MLTSFGEVYAALQAGKQVRLAKWDKGTILFADGNELFQLVRGEHLFPYSLDWREMKRKDWRIL